MLRLRRQLPVYSPIRLQSLLAGFTGALGFGRPLERLHRRLTERYGTADHLLTESGTSALRLAIEGALETGGALRESADPVSGSGVVALPAYCCPDVVTAAVGAGANIRLYDVDPETLGPDWGSLEAALRAGAAVLVVAHLYGIPVDMGRVNRLADAHGALVIEDAAQGFGGRIGDRPLGALGALGVLSFGRGKGITGGGGGALLANDERGQAALAAAKRQLGRGAAGWGELFRLAAQWVFGRPAVYGIPASLPWLGLGETHYRDPWPARGIARGAAAALLANWEASAAEAGVRRENAERLRTAVGEGPVTSAPAGAGMLRQPLLLDAGTPSPHEALAARSAGAERGYPPLERLPELMARRTGSGAFPAALRLADRLWTLPTHSLSDPSEAVEAARTLLK